MTKGLYVQTLGKTIHSVQVEDSAGNSWPLEPQQYIAREHQPPIEDLPTQETYTRNRYLAAICEAFGGARVVSPSNTWQVVVESTPAREIFLSPAFVKRNIEGGGMQPADLTKHLQGLGDSSWATLSNGTLTIVLN